MLLASFIRLRGDFSGGQSCVVNKLELVLNPHQVTLIIKSSQEVEGSKKKILKGWRSKLIPEVIKGLKLEL